MFILPSKYCNEDDDWNSGKTPQLEDAPPPPLLVAATPESVLELDDRLDGDRLYDRGDR